MRRLIVLACVTAAPLPAIAAQGEPGEQCAQAKNDDTIRPYDAYLRPGLLQAYRRLFPNARMPADQAALEAQTHIRCMDGRLLACFTGANLSCARLNQSRNNQGADAYCKANPRAPFVPAYAAGHDAAYSFRCVAGKAEVIGSPIATDQRGYAADQWAPID